MTAKEWLNRARKVDTEIETLVLARDRERDRVLKMTQSLDGILVSGTRDPHRYDKLAELELELDRQIDRLVDIKAEVAKEIARLSNPMHRMVLTKRYIECLTFEKIAVELKYSYKQTCRIHGRALIKMEEQWKTTSQDSGSTHRP